MYLWYILCTYTCSTYTILINLYFKNIRSCAWESAKWERGCVLHIAVHTYALQIFLKKFEFYSSKRRQHATLKRFLPSYKHQNFLFATEFFTTVCIFILYYSYIFSLLLYTFHLHTKLDLEGEDQTIYNLVVMFEVFFLQNLVINTVFKKWRHTYNTKLGKLFSEKKRNLCDILLIWVNCVFLIHLILYKKRRKEKV